VLGECSGGLQPVGKIAARLECPAHVRRGSNVVHGVVGKPLSLHIRCWFIDILRIGVFRNNRM